MTRETNTVPLDAIDPCVEAITGYVFALREDDMRQQDVHLVTMHILDTIGCAAGAINERPCAIARRLASTNPIVEGASVFGLATKTSLELAAFANTTMARYLDFNDTGIGGHPSDMILPLIATAEARGCSGRRTLLDIFAAYEVYRALRRGGFWRLRQRHVDQLQCTIATAMGAGVILALDKHQMANALALALTPSIPLRVTRTGELSDWKGCATAHGAMNALFAARLAQAGMTGPARVFSGRAGLSDFTNVDFDFSEIGVQHGNLSAIEATGLKRFPAEFSAQGPLNVAVSVRNEYVTDDIEHIEIALHYGGWEEIGGGQNDRAEKWRPQTRETADHSLAYLLARYLIDGDLGVDSFTPAHLSDPRVLELMDRIDVIHLPELDTQHAGEIPRWPSIMTIRLRDGRVVKRESGLTKGHPLNPLSEADVEVKVRGLCQRTANTPLVDPLFSVLHRLEHLENVQELTALFRQARCTAAA
jgi:2-methylcitrate dehydratase